MSEPPDPLEAELSTLRPRETSLSLRLRIADRLAGPRPLNRGRTRRILAVGGGLAAACLIAAVSRWVRSPDPKLGPIIVHAAPTPTPKRQLSWSRTRSPRSSPTTTRGPSRRKHWTPCLTRTP